MAGEDKPRYWVTLLRAVNVGGGTTVRMREIVDIYRSIGLTEVSAYGQAGSVVFAAPGSPHRRGLTRRIDGSRRWAR